MKRRKRIQFWGEDEDDDSLVREIISGKKLRPYAKQMNMICQLVNTMMAAI